MVDRYFRAANLLLNLIFVHLTIDHNLMTDIFALQIEVKSVWVHTVITVIR